MKKPSKATSAQNGTILRNIIHFSRLLRSAGMQVSPSSTIDAINAFRFISPTTREEFYSVLHCVFVKRHDQEEVFRDAFYLFWRSPKVLDQLIAELLNSSEATPDMEDKNNRISQRVIDAFEKQLQDLANTEEEREKKIEISMSYSGAEKLQNIDFEKMTVEELYEAKKAISSLRFPIDEISTRRFRTNPRGLRVDMRKTLRSQLKPGGDLNPLKKCKNIKRPPDLILLCDISGSMSRYSRMFLHFMHAVTSDRDKVTVFIFGTSLTNITRFLRHKDVDYALDLTSRSTGEWSGGTRIGESLRQFNFLWSRRVLGQGATVLLITDGLDRDDLNLLKKEISRLHDSCRCLIWLNPLLRYEAFKAEAGGIRTMLPYVDEFRSAHNLQSLIDISEVLRGANSDMVKSNFIQNRKF
tara:strand:- start:3841 stop:5076 length:1236 start_codon:yes stop_codon:yes gene_type:complete